MVYLGKSIEREMYFGAKPELFARAGLLRKKSTEAETILWKCLKKFRSEGFIFRRQHPIDIFIADFYCHRLKLVIEVDGGVHLNAEAQQYDGRTGELERFGITVISFTNDQVVNNRDFVVKQIKDIINDQSSTALLGAGDRRG
jgi:very-short-patch-repair endonuclease